MNISKEHIEELIFEYHEGNLSDGEKSELMNIIHQYPEFEADFALWAQTYAHVEDSVPDYGLAANLIQKAPLAWYAHTWVKVGLASVLVASGIAGYWLLNSNKEKTTTLATKPTIQQVELKEEPKELVPQTTIPNIKVNNISQVKETDFVPKTSSILEEKSSLTQEKLVEKVTETIQNEEIKQELIPEKVIPVEVISKPDTVQKATISEPKKIAEEKPQKKAKRKLPLNLKPAADFMPVNPNF